ncbi:MAG TPA: GntR family transcriptional regulator [Devosia sp.]|nr:GntR family transcriptional regulator [Devosia sp.]
MPVADGDADLSEGYHAFFDALLERRLTLGQTLRQDELCEILGVSLSPMREAMTLLQSEGLITVRKRIGVTIFYPDVKFVRETFQFRGFLEREGLRRFARSAPREWVAAARRAHREMVAFVKDVDDEKKYRQPVRALESEFHGRFIGAFDNSEASAIYARLQRKMYLLRLINPEAVGTASTVQAMREHMAIIDAVEQRAPDAAAEALDRHLQGVIHRVLS